MFNYLGGECSILLSYGDIGYLFYPFCPWMSINIPPLSGGYFSFGHSPNITGCTQVRFLWACQPCMGYLLPVNGSLGS